MLKNSKLYGIKIIHIGTPRRRTVNFNFCLISCEYGGFFEKLLLGGFFKVKYLH